MIISLGKIKEKDAPVLFEAPFWGGVQLMKLPLLKDKRVIEKWTNSDSNSE